MKKLALPLDMPLETFEFFDLHSANGATRSQLMADDTPATEKKKIPGTDPRLVVAPGLTQLVFC